MAALYRTAVGDLTGEAVAPVVRVVGHVGAGGEWLLADGSENGGIGAPRYATPDTVAVKIRGNSMGPALNGWYAIYEDIRHPPTDDLLGRI